MLARMAATLFRTGLPLQPKREQLEGRTIAWIGHVEIRLTRPCVVVETRVKGIRREARAKGLRRIQDYARGKNRAHAQVALSGDVVVQEERPALFRVQVCIPARHQPIAFPAPLDPKVRLVETPSELLAVQHVPRRLTPKVVACVEAEMRLCLQRSRWIQDSTDRLRLAESARTLPFRPYEHLALRVQEEIAVRAI